jgi:hypothetical protein
LELDLEAQEDFLLVAVAVDQEQILFKVELMMVAKVVEEIAVTVTM